MEGHIGLGIRHFRKKVGWSQRELARRAGLAHSTVAGVERGEINPSINTLQKLADTLKVPISQFFLEIEYS